MAAAGAINAFDSKPSRKFSEHRGPRKQSAMRNSRTGALAALQSARASGPRRPDSAASYGGLSYHSNATGSPTMTDQYSLVQKWRTQTLRPSTKGGGSPKSTIAMLLQKWRLNYIEMIMDGRDVRERRECRILLSRLHTKKEYLQIVRERLTDLQRQNVELKAEILSHESGVLNKVQSMIERCSRYEGSKQVIHQMYRKSKGAAVERGARAAVIHDGDEEELQEALKHADLELLREVTWLRELILYREVTAAADVDFIARLKVKIESTKVAHMEAIAGLKANIVQSMKNHEQVFNMTKKDYLNTVLTDSLKVLGPGVSVDSLTKQDLDRVNKVLRGEVRSRKDRVAKLKAKNYDMNAELAKHDARQSSPHKHVYERIDRSGPSPRRPVPNRQHHQAMSRLSPEREDNLVASLALLAHSTQIPLGYSSNAAPRPPFTMP